MAADFFLDADLGSGHPKTNMDSQNDGLEKVTTLKHGHFWYLSMSNFWSVITVCGYWLGDTLPETNILLMGPKIRLTTEDDDYPIICVGFLTIPGGAGFSSINSST